MLTKSPWTVAAVLVKRYVKIVLENIEQPCSCPWSQHTKANDYLSLFLPQETQKAKGQGEGTVHDTNSLSHIGNTLSPMSR